MYCCANWINFVFIVLPQIWHCKATMSDRQKRFVPVLIYPRSAPTRVQWIVGIGIPLEDLLYEAMTTGYVFKADYVLPDMAASLYTKATRPITAREFKQSHATKFERFLAAGELRRQPMLDHYLKTNKKILSSYRWSIYKALEGLAERVAPPGRACVLKSICEAAEAPFHYRNGLLGELLHILLSPSSSVDELSEYADNEYFHAESLGRSGANCAQVFKDCPESLLERFSDIYNIQESMLKQFG